MLALLKYNFKVYIMKNKFLVYYLLYVFLLIIYNNSMKIEIKDSVNFCANILFITMVLIGYKYSSTQDWRAEQIIYLRVKNNNKYWFSKILFMILLGISLSILGLIILITTLLINGYSIDINNLFIGLIILIIIACLGGLLGLCFSKGSNIKSNYSIMLLTIIIIFSELKTFIIAEWKIVKIFQYITPPVNEIVLGYSDDKALGFVLFGFIYLIIEIIVYIVINTKKLF